MTMFHPPADYDLGDAARVIAQQYECTERATEEVLHYARVLGARGVPPQQLLMMVGRYARVRGEYDKAWYY